MIYDYAKQLVLMFFLITIVNLLEIADSYKKIITFYMHFLIVIIILNPLLRIMNNEVDSFIGQVTFVNERAFYEAIQSYQETLGANLEAIAVSELESRIEEATRRCQTEVRNFKLDEVLIIQLTDNSRANQNCMIVELGLNREDIVFEGGIAGE